MMGGVQWSSEIGGTVLPSKGVFGVPWCMSEHE